MRITTLALILVASIYLSGCASSAKMENMAYQGQPKDYSEKLKKNVEIASVSGGEETNPAWTSEISDEEFSGAIKQSLLWQGLLADDGRYELEVKLLEVDQPLFGFDLTVTTHVQYILTDTKDGAVIFDETIVAPHTATMDDSFAAVKRLRLANEGSGKKNIRSFLWKLSKLRIKPDEVSIAQ